MNYAQEIRIRCPVATVFSYMDDVGRESEWQPNLVEAGKEPAGPTAVGTRKSYESRFLGKRIRNTYRTVAFEPNARVVYETTPNSALRGTLEIRFRDLGNETVVSMSFSGGVGGPLRFLPERVLERASRAGLEAALDRLKDNLES